MKTKNKWIEYKFKTRELNISLKQWIKYKFNMNMKFSRMVQPLFYEVLFHKVEFHLGFGLFVQKRKV